MSKLIARQTTGTKPISRVLVVNKPSFYTIGEDVSFIFTREEIRLMGISIVPELFTKEKDQQVAIKSINKRFGNGDEAL